MGASCSNYDRHPMFVCDHSGFIIDTAESVRTALDLARVLDAMTKMKAELDDVQVQLALLKAETEQKLEEAKEDTAVKLETLRVEAAGKAAQLRNETAERAAQLNMRQRSGRQNCGLRLH